MLGDLITALIFALIAGVIFFKIRDVLGQEDDGVDMLNKAKKGNKKSKLHKIKEKISLNGFNSKQPLSTKSILGKRGKLEEAAPLQEQELWKEKLAFSQDNRKQNTLTDQEEYINLLSVPEEIKIELKKMEKSDKNLKISEFLIKVKDVFKRIVNSYVLGDLDGLKELTSDDFYKNCVENLNKNSDSEENKRVNIVAMENPEIIDAKITNSQNMAIKLKISTKQKILYFDKGENLIRGSMSKIFSINEIWEFSKKAQPSSYWKLTSVQPLPTN